MHLAMAYDLAKRDAIKVYVSRLVDWLVKQALALEDALPEADRQYRAGWNAAMAHVKRHLLGS